MIDIISNDSTNYSIITATWQPFKSINLKASIIISDETPVKNIENDDYIDYMTRNDADNYLIHIRSFSGGDNRVAFLDGKTMQACFTDLNAANINALHTSGEYTLMLSDGNPVQVFRNCIRVGLLGIAGRFEDCNESWPLTDKWSQQKGDHIYIVEHETEDLYRVNWSDIKNSDFGKKVKILSKVTEFCLSKGGARLAAIQHQELVIFPGSQRISLKIEQAKNSQWQMVVSAAGKWVVGINVGGYAILTSIKHHRTKIQSLLSVQMTSSGTFGCNRKEKGQLYCIKTAIERRDRAILLLVEKDAICHAIGLEASGKMTLLHSVPTLVPLSISQFLYRVVTPVVATSIEGEFLAGGKGWVKKISIKLAKK